MKDSGLSNFVRLALAVGVAYVAWTFLFPTKPPPPEPEPPVFSQRLSDLVSAVVNSICGAQLKFKNILAYLFIQPRR